MRYQAEHKSQTRQAILAQAADAIRGKGAARVGVAEVMQLAGLTHGGFYAHFKSKDELVAAAIEQMFVQSLQRFQRRTAGHPPLQAMGLFVDGYLAPAHCEAPAQGCPLAALVSELPRLPAAARAQFDAGSEQLVAAITQLLRRARSAGAEAMARSLLAELVGALSLARSSTDARRRERILRSSREQIKDRLSLWSQA